MTMNYISKQIDHIRFGMLSPRHIKKSASVKIVTAELYDKDGYPVDGGLMDIKLGVIDPGLRCKTCGEKLKKCVGHFGYIELARPVYHINYIKTIYDVLRAVCKGCSKVMVDEKTLQIVRKKLEKLQEEGIPEDIRQLSKKILTQAKGTVKCPHCSERQSVIKFEKPSSFLEGEIKLSPVEVSLRLEKIPNEDAELMGFNPRYARPEWGILTVLGIPPVTMRPSITLDTGERSEDDLTHKLGDIVRINQRLFENINAGAPEVIVEDLWDLLQYHITTYFNNEVPQVPPARHRSGQPLKTLIARIKSKEGRFRHNLAGKRVNFAARAVISPDPEIEFNEVGVPMEVAMEITIPERVTEWNIEWLKKFITNGPNKYPGANYVYKPDGQKKKVTDESKAMLLEEVKPGYSVERQMIDGDISIFNRQPSLHRMSIMCHRVKVLPGKSFRLHPCVCNPYNADFDGDEMNLHIPQTEEARAEAELLMEVQTQIMTPKNGTNIIGCVEDAITGNYLLTRYLTLSKQDAIGLLVSIGIDNASKFKKFKDKVGGKEIFSVLLPTDLEFRGKAKEYQKCPICKSGKACDIHDIVIKDGQLISGVLDSNSIGEENGEVIKEIYRKYRENITIEILGKMFKLGVAVLLKYGFTIGLSAIELGDDIKVKIEELITEAKKNVDQLIMEFEAGKMLAYPGRDLHETLELKILQILNKIRNDVGNLVSKNTSSDNAILLMNKAGKGKIINLAMMGGIVGQQELRGMRIKDGYNQRTLTIFRKGELSPESRGFIKSSYIKGLSPSEFYFAAMTGRDSLMDTALRTPKSGYLYRRLSNAMQDLKVEYDNTVRDANKTIIQFKYGDDAIDVSKSDHGTINVDKIAKEVSKS